MFRKCKAGFHLIPRCHFKWETKGQHKDSIVLKTPNPESLVKYISWTPLSESLSTFLSDQRCPISALAWIPKTHKILDLRPIFLVLGTNTNFMGMWPVQLGLRACFMLCCCHLEFLNNIWTKSLTFSFCTGPYSLRSQSCQEPLICSHTKLLSFFFHPLWAEGM